MLFRSDGWGSHAWLNGPEGLAWDAAGNLLVADTGNSAIRQIAPDGTVRTLPLGGAPRITTQPAGASVSPGTAVLFQVEVQDASTVSYQWRKDGANITGASSARYAIAAATTADAGSYTVVATNAFGSTTSSAALLAVTAPSTPPAPSNAGTGAGGGAPSWVSAGLLALLVAGRACSRRR